MRNDTNGSNELQWFMFRMRNTGTFSGNVRITIVNFTKTKSLFLHVCLLTCSCYALGNEAVILVKNCKR